MPEPLSVGIAGFGAIGQAVAAAFATEDGIPGLRLAAIGARDAAKVRATLPKPGVNLTEHDAIPAKFGPKAQVSLE